MRLIYAREGLGSMTSGEKQDPRLAVPDLHVEHRAAHADRALGGDDPVGALVAVAAHEPRRAGQQLQRDVLGGAAASDDIAVDDDGSALAEHQLGAVAELELALAGGVGPQPLVAIDRIGSGDDALAYRALAAHGCIR